jgi:hypothetical protein
MVQSLPEDLITRIRERAADPGTRTDAPPSTRGQTVTVGTVSVVGLSLGAVLRGDPQPAPKGGAAALPPPADEAAIADAEKKLGFALPQPVRQLYGQVANGGFGPGAGIMPLEEVVHTYLELLATPPGRRGQKWPVRLLPVRRDEPGLCCVDVDSGAVVFWDEEELAAGASDKVWKRSFKPEAPDVATWLERWLGSPSPEQQTKHLLQKAMLDSIRVTLAHWRSKTPEERAAYGLPEKGWEEKLFGHLGVDLSKL